MKNPVNHFEICVNDLAKGKQFYNGMFGWKAEDYKGMNYAMVEKQGDGIGGGILQAEKGQFNPYVSIYVTVEDIEATLAKVEELGGKTCYPKTAIGDGMGFIGMFTDPDGNMIGLWSEK